MTQGEQQAVYDSGGGDYPDVSPEHIRAFWHDEDENAPMEDSM